jgi:hypothetical protein
MFYLRAGDMDAHRVHESDPVIEIPVAGLDSKSAAMAPVKFARHTHSAVVLSVHRTRSLVVIPKLRNQPLSCGYVRHRQQSDNDQHAANCQGTKENHSAHGLNERQFEVATGRPRKGVRVTQILIGCPV